MWRTYSSNRMEDSINYLLGKGRKGRKGRNLKGRSYSYFISKVVNGFTLVEMILDCFYATKGIACCNWMQLFVASLIERITFFLPSVL